MRIITSTKEKLQKKSGLTFTETLVALAIISLICAVLTMGITTAFRIRHQAMTAAESQILCGTLLTSLEDELRYAENMQSDGTTIRFNSASFGNNVSVKIVDGKVFLGNEAGNMRLLSDETYTSGLQADVKLQPETEKNTDYISITVTISKNGKNYMKQTVHVSPLNGITTL